MTAGKKRVVVKRAEQARAAETRSLILQAALSEFAENGFDAASIRNIADRINVQHPLITYHYSTKDVLWQAVAEHAFTRIRDQWDENISEGSDMSALERLREEYKALFRFTVEFPQFHRFMRQETRSHSPRLQWVAQKMLSPLIERLLPQIRAAQEEGSLPQVEPIIFHYLMISLTSTLSGFGPEMEETSGLSPNSPEVVDGYWRFVEQLVFSRPGQGQSRSDRAAAASSKRPAQPRKARSVKASDASDITD
ncbi:hypothetical protein CAF53_03430 [Sphingobium sp. LB126]|uniref:TetR/AcrR family transcriptional regulator n=1 Tax=Sphingobium sp. LB126 TaxID=1983755 RepID=UPI000C207AB5|nr:TetR/AcrR family transcriptional regulator [Sphingobium sp. LB126]PJG47397.1 hypothetical protein CAF53_03430 [Sphingobium sp. LB126]